MPSPTSRHRRGVARAAALVSTFMIALVLHSGAVGASPASPPPEGQANVASDIAAVLKTQVDAWNRGDLEGFMSAYLPSPEMTFTSGGTLTKGYDALRAKYAKSYGTDTRSMGQLRFDDVQVTSLGREGALSVGRFTLQAQGQAASTGIFSLVWVRTKAGWRIIHDHSSAQTGGTASANPSAKTASPQRVTLPGGLVLEDVTVGTGAQAMAGRTVSVHYTGWLASGQKFDSSVDRGQPFEFVLGAGQVIPGWDRGVQGMKVGGKRRLTIPAAMGYGDRGAGGVIPPGATLYFEVELLQVR